MYSIIDSHIHLLDENEDLWNWEHPHFLAGNHRLQDYIQDSQSNQFHIRGVVWIEADARYTLDNGIEGTRAPIDECKFVLEYLGLYPGYVVALVPWAPVPWGSKVSNYVAELKKELGSNFSAIKGFRFLLQDKPSGVMTDPAFISGLKWFQDHDYAFDWGIDIHNGGSWQFEESISVFQQVPNIRYIINHLTKPNLDIDPAHVDENTQFQQWKKDMTRIYELTPRSYMKLSGGFSEIQDIEDLDHVVDAVFPWFKHSFDLWGVDRTIWASNWPVCSMSTGDNLAAKWFAVTEKLFDRIELSVADRKKVYEDNWRAAYKV